MCHVIFPQKTDQFHLIVNYGLRMVILWQSKIAAENSALWMVFVVKYLGIFHGYIC